MKLIIFLTLLLQSGLSQATIIVPNLNEIIRCTHNVFHGEVISGAYSKTKADMVNKDIAGTGSYKIKVIEHFSAKNSKILNQATIQADYFNSPAGGFSMFHPAPGREYIFIVTKNGRNLKFSPYHLPAVEYMQGQIVVIGGQHRFVEEVEYYYNVNGEMLKTLSKQTNINDGSFVGYKFDSYKNYIAEFFENCPSDK